MCCIWSAPGFECAPRNIRCIYNFTEYLQSRTEQQYGGEIGSYWWGHLYWSYNAADQQCCWNKWLTALPKITDYYYDIGTWLESAYDGDNDPSTAH